MIKNTLFSLFALLLVNLVSAQEEQTSSTQQYETAISTESPADAGNLGEVDEFVGGGLDETYSIDRGILILLSAGLLISTLYFRRKFVIR